MPLHFKSLIAATALVGLGAFASAQTPASGPARQLVATAAVKAPAKAGARKSAVAVKKKQTGTVVAKKRLSKQKPHVKLGAARKRATGHAKA